MLILSHNFDFYRTISSRLGLDRQNRLCAKSNKSNIVLEVEKYQNQPFISWKTNPNKKNIIALIPFIRNLIEYGKDFKIKPKRFKIEKDFDFLTMLLHQKAYTSKISFKNLKKIYKTYLGIEKFNDDVDLNESVISALYKICDNLSTTDVELENKILLAMAIRHKAEEFMIDELNTFTGNITWQTKQKSNSITKGSSNEFLANIKDKTNQTRVLINAYKQFGKDSAISTLENVGIMTPENIHINSFMYEPIMDMDILELTNLYNNVKNLKGKN